MKKILDKKLLLFFRSLSFRGRLKSGSFKEKSSERGGLLGVSRTSERDFDTENDLFKRPLTRKRSLSLTRSVTIVTTILVAVSIATLITALSTANGASNSREMRIAIIGAGASGLTAAHTLKKLGYKNVTIFEKENRVGGKIQTVMYEGQPYELGAVLASNQYKVIQDLAREFNVVIRPWRVNVLLADSDFQTYNLSQYISSQISWRHLGASLIQWKKFIRRYKFFLRPGVEEVPIELTLPMAEISEKYNFTPLTDLFAPIITGTGYGYYSEVPAFYHLKLLTPFIELGIKEIANSVFLPFFTTFQFFPNGYQELFNALAKTLDVRLNTPVLSVLRTNGEKIKIITSNNIFLFDKLIVSCDLRDALKFLDTTSEEQALFPLIKDYKYYTTLFKAQGMKKNTAIFFASSTKAETIGHVTACANYFADESIQTAYQLAPPEMGREVLLQMLKSDIRNLGGSVEKIIVQKDWSYFPHVNSGELERGFYKKLMSLQGSNDTYYMGSVFHMESVLHTTSFSEGLILKYFR